VLVIERHERQVALGCALVLELGGGLYLILLAGVLELLVTAREQRKLRAGPGARNEVERFLARLDRWLQEDRCA